jgi:hypothetical protein
MSTLQTIHGRLVDLHRYLGPTVRGSMPFCVELDNIKDTGVPVHPPAVSPVAAG